MPENRKRKFKFTVWSDGDKNPERTIKPDKDTSLTAHFENERIISLYKGKIGEYKIIGDLLAFPMDVFLPVLDIRGIDCIVKLPNGKLREIQIKTRGTQKRGKEIFDVRKFTENENYFIFYYREDVDTYWVLPSYVFKENLSQRKNGKYRLLLNEKKQKKLDKYRNNLSILFESVKN